MHTHGKPSARRLYRSRDERLFAGVCGGLAEYFNIDPIIVRLTFVFLQLVGGPGILLYILLWIIVHYEP
ncbi:MAG: PspC domain-containing protein [Candidatus Hatepunaea meridiana]|nr:PspC domain-containing protein [Candidatus Hatepunaea meridiana]